jgi:CelD/BcsL family acetyltransferase involved in cellulose biosynthesis
MRQPFKHLVESAGGLVSVDPLVDAAWGDLLERAPASTIFHHPAWLRLIRDHYGYSMSAWCLRGSDGRLVGGVPVALVDSRLTGARFIALPFSDSCPPLLDPSAGVDISRVAGGVSNACAQFGLALEVRGALAGSPEGAVIERYVQHQLTLQPDIDRVVQGFTKAHVLRGVAKARREGVTIERRTDREGLARFYRLHTLTRRHQGVPTQSRRFILGFSELFDAGLGFVMLARHQGRDIAAAVFFTDGRTLTYKFGASDRRFLSVRPNNLLFMEAIRWGCEHEQRVLDFGRTDHDNDGLRAFKKTWGATESPLEFTYFGDYNQTLGRGLARQAMSIAIKHAPPTFGRLLGETLYRHFG